MRSPNTTAVAVCHDAAHHPEHSSQTPARRTIRLARSSFPRRTHPCSRRAQKLNIVTWLIVSALACLALAACGSSSHSAKPSSAGATISATCPRIAPAQLPPERWPGARKQLAPPGATAVRLCRYSGTNATLISSRLIETRSVIDQLVNDFDALPPARGAIACPAGNLAQIIALLAYPRREMVTISTELTGCATVTNGSVYRTAMARTAAGPRLLATLRRYVG